MAALISAGQLSVVMLLLLRCKELKGGTELTLGCSPGDPKVFSCSDVPFQDGGIEPVEQGQLLSKW